MRTMDVYHTMRRLRGRGQVHPGTAPAISAAVQGTSSELLPAETKGNLHRENLGSMIQYVLATGPGAVRVEKRHHI